MWKDPIVEETRERREQYAASLHHDLDAIFADIRKRQANGATPKECRPLCAGRGPARI
jgi:hypothetical protein